MVRRVIARRAREAGIGQPKEELDSVNRAAGAVRIAPERCM
jgi:hypothetical protein